MMINRSTSRFFQRSPHPESGHAACTMARPWTVRMGWWCDPLRKQLLRGESWYSSLDLLNLGGHQTYVKNDFLIEMDNMVDWKCTHTYNHIHIICSRNWSMGKSRTPTKQNHRSCISFGRGWSPPKAFPIASASKDDAMPYLRCSGRTRGSSAS